MLEQILDIQDLITEIYFKRNKIMFRDFAKYIYLTFFLKPDRLFY